MFYEKWIWNEVLKLECENNSNVYRADKSEVLGRFISVVWIIAIP